MIEVADIFRLHWASYQQQHAVLPTEHRAVEALLRCRTAACGGRVYQCGHCGKKLYSYHSCRHRACPKCHGQQTRRWLEKQEQRLLSCGYYLLTFTLPASCRALAWTHPEKIYGLLLSSAAAALQKLAWDPRYVGAQLGMLAVLHTWSRSLLYHPHAHLLVTAGGLARDGQSWVAPKNPAFLAPAYALSKIFRGKFRAGVRKLGLLHKLPDSVWKENWVVHCQHAGSGAKALGYLSRYVFRTAIANSRLEGFENGQVTFCYRDNRTQQLRHPTLSAHQFIRRFLAHVLPKGFVKVRSYGLWGHQGKTKLQRARQLLADPSRQPAINPRPKLSNPQPEKARLSATTCPCCRTGHLQLVQELWPQRTRAP